jgi:hypothetical protein
MNPNDHSTGEQPSARRFSRRSALRLLGAGAVIFAGGSSVDAFAVEPRWIEVTRPVIPVAGLPPAWEGVRIAHLTDLHAGPLIEVDYVRKAVAMACAESPDVIVTTGDYVSGPSALSKGLAAALAPLTSRGGCFAVLGNHDYWANDRKVSAAIREAGLTLLTNAHVILERGGQKLCIAGVDDPWEGKPRLEAAVDGVDESIPRVVLCHNPDYAEHMPEGVRADLMLCGHTHGGQLKIPLFGRPWSPIRYHKYSAGLAQGPMCPVYTSRGLGMVGFPIRFNCRPELPIVTLVRA